MFLKRTSRKKDGKVHDYWSIVENRRVAGGRVLQRHVLYLGEINSTQQAAWRQTIDLVVAGHPVPRTMALFPDDRLPAVVDDQVVAIRLCDLQLHRPRQWGACWLTDQLWRQLGLHTFWRRQTGFKSKMDTQGRRTGSGIDCGTGVATPDPAFHRRSPDRIERLCKRGVRRVSGPVRPQAQEWSPQAAACRCVTGRPRVCQKPASRCHFMNP